MKHRIKKPTLIKKRRRPTLESLENALAHLVKINPSKSASPETRRAAEHRLRLMINKEVERRENEVWRAKRERLGR